MGLELEPLFSRGLLVRPSDEQTNLVHLVRAIAALAGVTDIPVSPPIGALMETIGPADQLVFILLDGLGMNIARRLPASSFVVTHLKRELHSTCPSTTACALTSVATAQYPNRHAVTGWFTRLPEQGISAALLPFLERVSGRPLSERGLSPQDVLPAPPIASRMSHRSLTVVPAAILNSPYNLYSRGSTSAIGYHSIPDAIDAIIAQVTAARHPTYTQLYLPEIDALCHKIGVGHADVLPLVLHIDSQLKRLNELLGGRARIIVSADHGLIDVPRENQALLLEGDTLLEMLDAPPTGDARMPIFHVREGRTGEFLAAFESRFGEQIALVDIDQAEHLELFGPGPFSPLAKSRFGDFIGFPAGADTLGYHPPNKPVTDLFVGVHGGLSYQEMVVPLCIA